VTRQLKERHRRAMRKQGRIDARTIKVGKTVVALLTSRPCVMGGIMLVRGYFQCLPLIWHMRGRMTQIEESLKCRD